jgi:hypothetical protein
MSVTLFRSAGIAALILIAALIAWGIMTPWGLGLDFANFYDAGRKAQAGEFADLYDPFAQIAGQKPLGNMTFFSAPLTSYLYSPMAALPPRTALLWFKLAGTLAQGAGLVLLYLHCRPLAGDTPRDRAVFFALFAIAALLFQPFWTIYRVGGQTTPFVFLLLVLGHIAFTRGALVWTALAFSAVVVIKPAFAPAAILLFVLSSNRFRLTALATGLGLGALSLQMFGLPLHQEFLARVLAEGGSLMAPWMNSSPFSWIEPIFVRPEAYQTEASLPATAGLILTALRLLTSAALLWALARQIRSTLPPAAERHAVYATGLALVVVLSPVIWSHYLTMLFIPLAVLMALRSHLPGGAVALLSLAVLLAPAQNLMVIRKLYAFLGFDTRAEILAVALLKSLPALLIVMVMIFWHRSLVWALKDAAWDRLLPPAPQKRPISA